MSEVTVGWSDGVAERETRVDLVRAAWRSAYAHIFTRAEIDGIFDGSLVGQGSWVVARVAPAGTLAGNAVAHIVRLAEEMRSGHRLRVADAPDASGK